MEKYLLDREMMKLSNSCSPFHSLCPSLSYTYLPLLSFSLRPEKILSRLVLGGLILMEVRGESHTGSQGTDLQDGPVTTGSQELVQL